jgi:hypothetical protein
VAIQSPNFQHLVSGWSINQDGTAEFNGVTINGGQLILVDGSGNVVGTLDGQNGLVLYGNGSASHPGMTLSPFGDLVWGNFDATADVGPSIELGDTDMFLSSGNDTGKQNAAVAISMDLGNGANGVQIKQYLYGNDRNGSGTPVGPVESWHDLSPVLSNSWHNSGGTTQGAEYRAMPDGTIMMHGTLTGGTATAFATLPAAYRPAHDLQFPSCGGASVTAGSMLRIIITAATGVMAIVGESVIGGSFSLDAVRFAAPDLV